MIFNQLVLLVGIFCLLYYLGMGFLITFSQSMLWLWPLAALVCFVRYALVRYSLVHQVPVPLPRWFILCWRIFLVLGFSLFFYVESFVVSGSFSRPPQNLDAIIVLGAKVNGSAPSGALDQRIDAAADYLRHNPNTLCIASGGQGEDEGISEAECIRRGLLAQGIEESRIFLEASSTSTEENFRYSVPLLPASATTVGVVTNNFHIFRSLKLAQVGGYAYTFYGVPASCTPAGYLHYSIREFCALVVLKLKGTI